MCDIVYLALDGEMEGEKEEETEARTLTKIGKSINLALMEF
jgi:hypothetical protein